jgi:DNA-binding transcriptional MerR regulator
MNKQLKLYLLRDVSRMLRTKPYQIVYLLTMGLVPEPPRLGNRRMFGPEDVRRLAERLGVEVQTTTEEGM